jgi:hypothetical protein
LLLIIKFFDSSSFGTFSATEYFKLVRAADFFAIMASSASSVPAKFLAAKDAICKHIYTSRHDSPFEDTTRGWADEEKRSFFEWFSVQTDIEKEERIRQQHAQPAMTMPQYIKALMNVDFSDEDTVVQFLNLTHINDYRPPPQPVVLGTEKCYQYQLISCAEYWDMSSDIALDVEESGVVMEMRSALANTKLPLQYIVPLGFLQCVTTHTYRTRSTYSSRPIDTPFGIVLNIVDKSLWMVLGSYSRDGIEPYEPIPVIDNNWDFLPMPANGRPTFDVMQILTWRDFIALEQTSAKARPFFSKEVPRNQCTTR